LRVTGSDCGNYFGGFVFKYVTGRIDGVGSHVKDGAGKTAVLDAMIVPVHALRKGGRKQMHLANLSVPNAIDGVERGGFKVETISDHEPGVGRRRGIENLVTLFNGDFERLLREHMDSRLQCRKDEFRMTPIWSGKIDGVEGAGGDGIRKLLVAEDCAHTVSVAELFCLGGIRCDERRDLRISRVVYSGHHVFLRDISEADDRVTDFGTGFEP